jgi:hypothetical protein
MNENVILVRSTADIFHRCYNMNEMWNTEEKREGDKGTKGI